jgi:hypothetical protein
MMDINHIYTIPIKNLSGETKFSDTFVLNDVEYEYTLYLLPEKGRISSVQRREIIHFFGNRLFKETPCLDIGESDVRKYIDDKHVSAFIIVKPVGVNNAASGTLQISNRCGNGNDIWINDVCRLGVREGPGNPLYAMFIFIEQLAVQMIDKTNLKLNVELHTNEFEILKSKYTGLGFIYNSDDNEDVCIHPGENKGKYLVMEKRDLVPNTNIIDFSFLRAPPRTSTPKTKTTAKRTRTIEQTPAANNKTHTIKQPRLRGGLNKKQNKKKRKTLKRRT